MATCTAIVPGQKGECLRPVPEDAPLQLCLLHGLLASEWVRDLGGANAVRAEILRNRQTYGMGLSEREAV